MMTPFQLLAKSMLGKWMDDPAVINLIARLGPGVIVDDAARVVTEAADAMAEIAVSKRDQPEWADRCLLMGAMRSLAPAIWRLDGDMCRVINQLEPDKSPPVSHLINALAECLEARQIWGVVERATKRPPHGYTEDQIAAAQEAVTASNARFAEKLNAYIIKQVSR